MESFKNGVIYYQFRIDPVEIILERKEIENCSCCMLFDPDSGGHCFS